MLLNPGDWSLAQQIDRVLPALSDELGAHVTPETHRSALELGTGVHQTVAVRRRRAAAAAPHARRASWRRSELRCASAGTHPFTVWHETVLSSGDRYETVYDSMRELARREPTFALHVHVGVPDPEAGIRLFNRMRAHLPLLLALSANSPFWQGRDTGLSSARTPLFQAFPRVGHPAAVRGLRRLGGHGGPAGAQRGLPGRRATSGGTCAPCRASAPWRCASWTPRPPWPRPPRWWRWCSASRGWRPPRASPRRCWCESTEAAVGEPLHRRARRHGGRADRPGVRVARAGPRAARRPAGGVPAARRRSWAARPSWSRCPGWPRPTAPGAS